MVKIMGLPIGDEHVVTCPTRKYSERSFFFDSGADLWRVIRNGQTKFLHRKGGKACWIDWTEACRRYCSPERGVLFDFGGNQFACAVDRRPVSAVEFVAYCFVQADVSAAPAPTKIGMGTKLFAGGMAFLSLLGGVAPIPWNGAEVGPHSVVANVTGPADSWLDVSPGGIPFFAYTNNTLNPTEVYGFTANLTGNAVALGKVPILAGILDPPLDMLNTKVSWAESDRFIVCADEGVPGADNGALCRTMRSDRIAVSPYAPQGRVPNNSADGRYACPAKNHIGFNLQPLANNRIKALAFDGSMVTGGFTEPISDDSLNNFGPLSCATFGADTLEAVIDDDGEATRVRMGLASELVVDYTVATDSTGGTITGLSLKAVNGTRAVAGFKRNSQPLQLQLVGVDVAGASINNIGSVHNVTDYLAGSQMDVGVLDENLPCAWKEPDGVYFRLVRNTGDQLTNIGSRFRIAIDPNAERIQVVCFGNQCFVKWDSDGEIHVLEIHELETTSPVPAPVPFSLPMPTPVTPPVSAPVSSPVSPPPPVSPPVSSPLSPPAPVNESVSTSVPSVNNQPPTPEPKKSSAGVIVGLVGGATFAFGLVVGAVKWLVRRNSDDEVGENDAGAPPRSLSDYAAIPPPAAPNEVYKEIITDSEGGIQLHAVDRDANYRSLPQAKLPSDGGYRAVGTAPRRGHHYGAASPKMTAPQSNPGSEDKPNEAN